MKFLPSFHKKSASSSSLSSNTSVSSAGYTTHCPGIQSSSSMPLDWLIDASPSSSTRQIQGVTHGDAVRRRVAKVMRSPAQHSVAAAQPPRASSACVRPPRMRKCPRCFAVYDASQSQRHSHDAVATHQATEALAQWTLASDLLVLAQPRSRSQSLECVTLATHDATSDWMHDEAAWMHGGRRGSGHSSRFVEDIATGTETESAPGQLVPIYLERREQDGREEERMPAEWHLNGERMFF